MSNDVFAKMDDNQFAAAWPNVTDAERSAAPAGFARYAKLMGSIGKAIGAVVDLDGVPQAPSADITRHRARAVLVKASD